MEHPRRGESQKRIDVPAATHHTRYQNVARFRHFAEFYCKIAADQALFSAISGCHPTQDGKAVQRSMGTERLGNALLVTDDLTNVEAVAEILVSLGHGFDIAPSQEGAWRHVHGHHYDYLLLDAAIPARSRGGSPRIQNGLNLLESVVGSVPVIILLDRRAERSARDELGLAVAARSTRRSRRLCPRSLGPTHPLCAITPHGSQVALLANAVRHARELCRALSAKEHAAPGTALSTAPWAAGVRFVDKLLGNLLGGLH